MIRGFLIQNNDFVMLAQDGLSFINIFQEKENRTIVDIDQNRWKLKSLMSCGFLKFGESNFISI